MRSLFIALALVLSASSPVLSGALSIPVPECDAAFQADVQGLHIRALGYSGWGSLELWHREDTQVTRSMLECQKESLAYLRELWDRLG